MYASLEDAWQDPILVPSDRGFVLHPRRRPEFLAERAAPLRTGYEVPPSADEEVRMPPAAHPRAYAPRFTRMMDPPSGLEEGFDGGAPLRNARIPYGGPARWDMASSRDDILRELQRVREELEWVRQDRADMQRRLDFICIMLFGVSVILLSDMIRRWSPKP